MATINVPEYDRQQYEAAMRSIKNNAQQVEKEQYADILKLHYPVFGDHIDYARAQG